MQRVRVRLGSLILLASVVVLMLFPTITRAAGYTVSDAASCSAFQTAIGATGSASNADCGISGGTLPAGDTLTVVGTSYTLRPNGLVFTNKGSVTITITGSDNKASLYNAGPLDNQGTLTVNKQFAVNYHTITNSGTIVINSTFYNFGTINNTGVIQITCAGSLNNQGIITGNPVQDLCNPTSTPVPPTNTPTNTQTNTPVPATATATHTPTNTPVPPTNTSTSTPTNTPLPTATALPVQSTIIASADSYVQQKDAKKNFGTKTALIVDGTDDPREVYVRFSVNAAGTIRKAVLRLYVTDGTKDGPRLYQAANNSWTETGLIWNTKPGATGPVLGNLGKVNDKVWVEFDVTSVVTGNDTYSFVLVGDSTESIEFTSREGTNKPQLVVTVQP